jgi:hypothetical protein
METIIAAINNKPAGEGFGSVLLSGLLAVGVMALIYGVLELMNYVRKKNDTEKKTEKPDVHQSSGSIFARVLEKQIEQRNEKKHENEDDNDRDMRV